MMTIENMEREYNEMVNGPLVKITGIEMSLMSILSDVQEELRFDVSLANDHINFVKYALMRIREDHANDSFAAENARNDLIESGFGRETF